MSGLRHARVFVQDDGFQTVTVINFPKDYSAADLRSIFPETSIVSCVILPRRVLEKSASWPQVRTRAEITFTSNTHAKDACALHGVAIGGVRLHVKPSAHQTVTKRSAQTPSTNGSVGGAVKNSGCQNNLYVSGLSKEIDDGTLRRVFARFGKIISFKVVRKSQFTSYIAYVAFKYPTQAALALQYVCQEPELNELGSEVQVSWHKKKILIQEETKEEPINVQEILQEFGLLSDSPAPQNASSSFQSFAELF